MPEVAIAGSCNHSIRIQYPKVFRWPRASPLQGESADNFMNLVAAVPRSFRDTHQTAKKR